MPEGKKGGETNFPFKEREEKETITLLQGVEKKVLLI